VPHFERERNIRRGTEFFGLNKKKTAMTAASIRSQLLYTVQEAKAAVERVPRPETYRALLESQSDLQRHDLEYGRRCEAILHHARWSRRDVDDAKAERLLLSRIGHPARPGSWRAHRRRSSSTSTLFFSVAMLWSGWTF
jgi:hypothetical protein